MSRTLLHDIGTALVDELAIVVGGLIDAPVEVVSGAAAAGPQWHAELQVHGAASGSLTLAFDQDGAATVAAAIAGLDGPVPANRVIDTLREICTRVLDALSQKPIAGPITLTLGTLTATAVVEPGEHAETYTLSSGRLARPLSAAVWGSLTLGERDDSRAAAAAGAAPRAASVPNTPAERLDVILDIDLPLTVRFGRTELPLKTLTQLGAGSLIDLGRSPDDPVEILVSNRVVAHGEVVIVSGNYGVRISQVVSPGERMRSMEE